MEGLEKKESSKKFWNGMVDIITKEYVMEELVAGVGKFEIHGTLVEDPVSWMNLYTEKRESVFKVRVTKYKSDFRRKHQAEISAVHIICLTQGELAELVHEKFKQDTVVHFIGKIDRFDVLQDFLDGKSPCPTHLCCQKIIFYDTFDIPF